MTDRKLIPERAREYDKKYRAKKRDFVLASAKAWRERNPEKVRAIGIAYRQANLDKVRAACRKATREWKAANPEKARAAVIVRRARELGASGTFNADDVRLLMRLQKGKCPVCLSTIRDKYHIDHVLPLASGGTNDRLNIQLLCPDCNLSKNASHPIDFMQRRGFLL